jgi:hypothetical protein
LVDETRFGCEVVTFFDHCTYLVAVGSWGSLSSTSPSHDFYSIASDEPCADD